MSGQRLLQTPSSAPSLGTRPVPAASPSLPACKALARRGAPRPPCRAESLWGRVCPESSTRRGTLPSYLQPQGATPGSPFFSVSFS